MDQIKQITERTLIPISLLIIIIGFVAWLTNLYAETRANGAEISEIKQAQQAYNQKLDRIMEKLNVMEGVLRGL